MESRLTSQLLIRLIDQWLYGLRSGLALHQTFTLLLNHSKNKVLNKINQHCLHYINQGHPLSYALQQIKNLKPNWISSYIAAGETQGDLSSVLQQLNLQLNQQLTIRKNIKKALAYPCAVLSIAMIITICLLTFVIPQFEAIYQQLNATLPYITQVTLTLSDHIQHHGFSILLSIAMPVFITVITYKKAKRLQLFIDTCLTRLPIIAPLVLMVNFCRWYSLLTLLLNAGISIDQALNTANSSLSYHALKRSLQQLVVSVQQGQSIAKQLQSLPAMPSLDCQLIQLGESTGQLSQTCQHLANHYQQQLSQLSTLVSQWLEPVIMLLLAVIVGGLVMAMYAPIFNLGNIM
ncbi:MAG: type II secretion system F family protein [Coxiellaceae bacterium]|nr:type II secretion system F family protein [Coxiellaceae bacterium]